MRLIALRKKKGFTARQLSRMINQNDKYVDRMERGAFDPPLATLERIVIACDSCLEELFYKEFEKYHMHKEIIEQFIRVGKEQKEDALITLLVAAYMNKQSEAERSKIIETELTRRFVK